MPQISRGKFDRLRRATAGFTTSELDGYGLRNHLPLVRHPWPPNRVLFIGSVLFHRCASLSLHVHHVVKRTCTSKLSNMLGTPKKSRSEPAAVPRVDFVPA